MASLTKHFIDVKRRFHLLQIIEATANGGNNLYQIDSIEECQDPPPLSSLPLLLLVTLWILFLLSVGIQKESNHVVNLRAFYRKGKKP